MRKVIFTALVALLGTTSCSNNGKGTETSATNQVQAPSNGEIVYVQVEEVLAKCDLYVNEGAALQEKTQKAQASWTQKEQSLQYEVAQLQEKYQKGLITSNDAQAQQKSIEQRAANFQNVAQRESKTIEEENYVFTNRAQDLLQRAITLVNVDNRYKMILNANALLDADSLLNITPVVLTKVNELYASDKKAPAAKKETAKK